MFASSSSSSSASLDQRQYLIRVPLPQDCVGWVIGSKHSNLKGFGARTNATVRLKGKPNIDQWLEIKGGEHAVDRALNLVIEQLCKCRAMKHRANEVDRIRTESQASKTATSDTRHPQGSTRRGSSAHNTSRRPSSTRSQRSSSSSGGRSASRPGSAAAPPASRQHDALTSRPTTAPPRSRPKRNKANRRAAAAASNEALAKQVMAMGAKDLPVHKDREKIIRQLKQYRILVVDAPPGTGKSTQLPQICMESFGGKVVATQPRAFAAISIARRVAEEIGEARPGQTVGYATESKTVPGRRIMFCCDAALVSNLANGALQDCEVLIIDEAHERTLFTDIILALVYKLAKEHPQLHIIVSSATINTTKFIEHFRKLTVGHASAVLHKVEAPRSLHRIVDQPDRDNTKAFDKPFNLHAVLETVQKYTQRVDGVGDILVFLPREADVISAYEIFRRRMRNKKRGKQNKQKSPAPKFFVYALYPSLPDSKQQELWKRPRDNRSALRRLIFTTSMAETAVTVPGVGVVIDSGWEYLPVFDPDRHVTFMKLTRISRASMTQRRGRTGRTCAGTFVPLYDHKKAIEVDYITPEIRRACLDRVLLDLAALQLSATDLRLLDAPEGHSVTTSMFRLKEAGCFLVDSSAGGMAAEASSLLASASRGLSLSAIGKLCHMLPLDPMMGFFVAIASWEFDCRDAGVLIAAVWCSDGSLFLPDDEADDETLREAKQKAASAALGFSSDLFLECHAYLAWRDSGRKQLLPATSGKRRCSRHGGPELAEAAPCQHCLRQHAQEHGLNLKVLQAINDTCRSVFSALDRSEAFVKHAKADIHYRINSKRGGELFRLLSRARKVYAPRRSSGILDTLKSVMGLFSDRLKSSDGLEASDLSDAFLTEADPNEDAGWDARLQAPAPSSGSASASAALMSRRRRGRYVLTGDQDSSFHAVFKSDHGLIDRIGAALYCLFPKQLGQLMVAGSPGQGMWFPSQNDVAIVEPSSFLLQQIGQERKDFYFVARTIVTHEDASQGSTCAGLHPVPWEFLQATVATSSAQRVANEAFCTRELSLEPRGSLSFDHLEKERQRTLSSTDPARLADNVLCVLFDKRACRIKCVAAAQEPLTNCKKKDTEFLTALYNERVQGPVLADGTKRIEFKKGLHMQLKDAADAASQDDRASSTAAPRSVGSSGNGNIYQVTVPFCPKQVQSKAKAKEWLLSRLPALPKQVLKSVQVTPGLNAKGKRTGRSNAAKIMVSVTNLAARDMIKQAITSGVLSEAVNSGGAGYDDANPALGGRLSGVHVTWRGATLDEKDLPTANGLPCRLKQTVSQQACVIVENLPKPSLTQLREELKKLGVDAGKMKQQPSVYGTELVKVTVPVIGHNVRHVESELGRTFANERYGTVQLDPTSPSFSPVRVVPAVTCTEGEVRYDAQVGDWESAERVAAHVSRLAPSVSDVKLTCALHVAKPQLFDLKQLMENCQQRAKGCAVRAESAPKDCGGQLILFEAASVAECQAAFKAFSMAVSPLRIDIDEPRERALFLDAKQNKQLERWCLEFPELSIELCMDAKQAFLEVHGPHSKQGELMRSIAEHSADFEKRYVHIPLQAEQVFLFAPGSAGATGLERLKAKFPSCLLEVDEEEAALLIVVNKLVGESVRNDLEQEVRKLSRQVGAHAGQRQQMTKCHREGCNRTLKARFASCGHGLCDACLDSIATVSLTRSVAQCPCGVSIVARDVATFAKVLTAGSVENFVRKLVQSSFVNSDAKSLAVTTCPNPTCDALVERKSDCHTCTICSTHVCHNCRVFNERAHLGISCDQYQLRKQAGDEIPAYFQRISRAARQFLRSNWPADLPPVQHIQENPALGDSWAASPSTQRFVKALHASSVSLAIQSGVFAWHGTRSQAIPAICHDGFDPRRRSGQAYGRGEYFGINASTSNGYCKGGTHMLVTFLLRVQAMSVHGTFCYVVDNPVDWSLSYCLPVLVVSFGSSSPIGLRQPQLSQSQQQAAMPNRSQPRPAATWSWNSGNNGAQRFVPFDKATSDKIEALYQAHQRGHVDRLAEINVVRANDAARQTYRLDFTRMLQINSSTGFKRAIQRL